MTYIIIDPLIGEQPIDQTSETQNHPLGKIVCAKDPTFGEGEFIYLVGVASTVVGSSVVWRAVTYQTILAPVGTNLPEALAFAMSANVATDFGWYQIGGVAVAKKAVGTSLATDIAVGINTIGLVSASSTGDEVLGALVSAVASAKSDVSTVRLMINRPRNQGRIT